MTTDPVKKRIQELVPDIKNAPCGHKIMGDENGCPVAEHLYPITLAVVLRAIEEATSHTEDLTFITSTGIFGSLVGGEAVWEKVIEWNLEHDNYDQQSEETKKFIGNLLGVNNSPKV